MRNLLDRLLGAFLEYTQSPCGFVGEVHPTPEAGPRFQVLTSSPPDWMETLHEVSLDEPSRAQTTTGLRPLLATALATGQPVSWNRLESPDDAPLGPGTPPLDSLWLLPIQSADELIGLMGIANPLGLPDANSLPLLPSALQTGALLLMAWRHEPAQRVQEETDRARQLLLEQLKQALTSVEDALWDWRVPTQEIYFSRRFLEMLGYDDGELAPTLSTWRSICHPEDLAAAEQHIVAHLKGLVPTFEFTYRTRRKSGEWAWVLTRARVVARDEQGRAVRVMGTDVDITARKESEARLSALIRTIPDILFRIRVDGTLIDWHDGTPAPKSLPLEEILGRKLSELPLPPSFIELTLSNVHRVIREGNLAVYEYELERMEQGVQRYEARVVRSGPDEAVCIVRNITERKLVEERQTQLVRAEKLASLGQLAAGIAHEINNPVGYVTSNLQTLDRQLSELRPLLELQRELLAGESAEERVLSAELLARLRALWKQVDVENLITEMPEIIQESLTGARRIKEIVQSLRSFSREDEGTPQIVDLNTELESTLRMVWNELKYKCEVKRDFGELPSVTCYPTQINQVFTNLLVNAAQAIETRGVIRIRTSPRQHEVVVEISDTGKGMSRETLARLFTPFFTTKPRGQGTGLGLSISRDIVTRHGGRIDVQSEPGRGTTFTVYLPFDGLSLTTPTG